MIAPSLEMSDDPEKKVKKVWYVAFFRIFEVSLRDGVAAYFYTFYFYTSYFYRSAPEWARRCLAYWTASVHCGRQMV